jgi:23S rRNA pseudouridine1911/1915/1917 synthase
VPQAPYTAEVEAQTFEIPPERAGGRLDRFLADRLELSRAEVRRLLTSGAVVVAGRPAGPGDKGLPLRAGDRVAAGAYTPTRERRIVPEPDVPLVVLAEGPGWLAVDKPAGVPVHPFEEDERGSMTAAIAARHPEIQGVGEGALRSGAVHRLDVDTSGVLLVATREDAWQRLRTAFRRHRVEKVYRAVVAGRLAGTGRESLLLVVGSHRPARVRVARDDERAGARETVTAWRALAPLDDATLVEARPVSGFLHQIRATFAHLGHPILGDAGYAPAEIAARAPRQLLHAASVRFEEVEAESPDPPDFPIEVRAF